jgi:hypothetical protein
MAHMRNNRAITVKGKGLIPSSKHLVHVWNPTRLYSVDTAGKRPPRKFDLSPLYDVTVENGWGYTFIPHIHVLHTDNRVFCVIIIVIIFII